MNDIETLVRDGLRYDGGLVGFESEGLIRRARRRRLAHRLGAGAAVVAFGLTAFATMESWTHINVGNDGAGPASDPSASNAPSITSLEARDQLTTPEGAVIVVTPDKLCVGNTYEEPSCLSGEDPSLNADDQTEYGFYTQSPDDFVYAWLVPEDSARATLQIGASLPQEAALYRVAGRELMIAVVTGATCWSADTRIVQLATDPDGGPTYKRDLTGNGTCP